MTNKFIISAIALLSLTACTTHLSEQDRSALEESRQIADEAKNQSSQNNRDIAAISQSAEKAAQEAARAARAAERASSDASAAAAAAQNASEKANRIFQHGSDK